MHQSEILLIGAYAALILYAAAWALAALTPPRD